MRRSFADYRERDTLLPKIIIKARVDLRKQKAHTYSPSHIYTHAYTCKYSKFFILLTSANYGHTDSIDFPNMYTRTHGRTNHIFIEQLIAVFSTYIHTHAHKMNIVWLLNCLFLNICCCHIPFVYVLLKFELYLWKRNRTVTPVNYER